MSDIYGFFVPNKCVNQIVDAISKGLIEFTPEFTCEVAFHDSQDSKSRLIQITVERDKDGVLGQLISNIARTMTYHSKLPWFHGMAYHRGTDVVWDHTIPKRMCFKWQRRKYMMKLDKAHSVFSSVIQEISRTYDKGLETNSSKLDEMLRYTR